MLDEKPILYYAAYAAPYGMAAPDSDFQDEDFSLRGVSENDTPLRIYRDRSGVYRIDLELTDYSYLDLERGIDYSLLIRGYDSPEAVGEQEDDHTSQMFVPYATFVERYMPVVEPDYDDGNETDIVEVVKFKFDCSVEYAHPGE